MEYEINGKTITTDDECFLTNRVFPGWWGDAKEGESYISEWACNATDESGEPCRVIYQFPAVKGEEPDDDGWPWEDERYVSVEY